MKVYKNVMFLLENYRILNAKARTYEAMNRPCEAASVYIVTEAIDHALDVLNDIERACICLIYMEFKTIPAVAREIYCSEGSVYRHRRSALEKLEAVLGNPLEGADRERLEVIFGKEAVAG